MRDALAGQDDPAIILASKPRAAETAAKDSSASPTAADADRGDRCSALERGASVI